MGRYAVILVLMAIYIAGQAWSASFQDTARDMFAAYGIRHGLAFPLEGPVLGDAVHLGPAWYYLLALPLWVHGSWIASALFAGVIGSLKFPLAYWCGSRLVDRDFGVFWAIALALPGWHSLEQLVFFNPNPAAASMLATLALLILASRPAPPRGTFASLGLCVALALHIHPTTAPLAAIALAVAWRSSPPALRGVRLAAIVAGFALPFLPYLASQAMTGFPDFDSATTYVERRVGAGNLGNWPALVQEYAWGGPEMVGRHILGWGALATSLLCALVVAWMVTPLVAIAARPGAVAPARPVVVGSVAAFVLFSAWIALLRPVTPFYFVLVLSPMAAALAAATLWRWRDRRPFRAVAAAAAIGVLALDMYVARDMARRVRAGDGVMPARVVDIKDRANPTMYSDVWFPAVARARLGRALCARPEGLALHGHLAYLVDRSLGVDALFACGRRDHVRLAGAGDTAGEHLLGMTRLFWSRIDAAPDCWIGSMGLAQAHPVGQAPSMAIADGAIYPPRRVSARPGAEIEHAFDVPRSRAVLVSNVTPGYQHLTVIAATVDGGAVSPLAANDLSTLYAPPPDGAPTARWRIRLRANEPAATDVVTIERGRGRARVAACGS